MRFEQRGDEAERAALLRQAELEVVEADQVGAARPQPELHLPVVLRHVPRERELAGNEAPFFQTSGFDGRYRRRVVVFVQPGAVEVFNFYLKLFFWVVPFLYTPKIGGKPQKYIGSDISAYSSINISLTLTSFSVRYQT